MKGGISKCNHNQKACIIQYNICLECCKAISCQSCGDIHGATCDLFVVCPQLLSYANTPRLNGIPPRHQQIGLCPAISMTTAQVKTIGTPSEMSKPSLRYFPYDSPSPHAESIFWSCVEVRLPLTLKTWDVTLCLPPLCCKKMGFPWAWHESLDHLLKR